MNKYVIDAWAWIEYLDGSEHGRRVARIVEDERNEIIASSATIAEVVSKFLRAGKNADVALDALRTLSVFVAVNNEIGASAGRIHHDAKTKNKDFGMLDAFVVATAQVCGARILTGDTDFNQFNGVVWV